MSPAVAPSPENPILWITALPHERKTSGWSGEHGELTKVGDEDEVGPEKVWSSGWWTAPTAAQAWPSRDDVGPLLRGKMERRGVASCFYNPEML
jgi:hypothetical protein